MGFFNKEVVEKEAVNLGVEAVENVITRFSAQKPTSAPSTGGLVSVIVEAVTNHVAGAGVAPDVTLLKTSIGQLIEGTVGVLQATGKLQGVEKSAAGLAVGLIANHGTVVPIQAPSITLPNAPKLTPPAPPSPSSIG